MGGFDRAAWMNRLKLWWPARVLVVLVLAVVLVLLVVAGTRRPSQGGSVDEYAALLHRVKELNAELGRARAAEPPLPIAETLAHRPKAAQTLALPVTTAGEGPKPAALQVTGIVWNPKQPLVMVNGEVLGLNEELDGFKVVAIERDKVTFMDRQGNKQVIEP